MEQQLAELISEARLAIASAEQIHDLQQIKAQYLGKKGKLTEILKGVGSLSAEDKPKIGKLVNEVKDALQLAFDQRETHLQAQQLQSKLAREKVDITLPGRLAVMGSKHPVTRVKERVIQLFQQMGFQIAEGPEIEDDYHNFTALNIPADHPARAMQDTFYLEGDRLLRTHTSPVQIRQMKQQGVPIRLIALGRVYRKDSDQTHTPMFHQVEGLVIAEHCTFANLKYVLQQFLNEFFEADLKVRFRPSYFPFTEPSAEVDIYDQQADRWLEVLGCGMVHPNVLRNVGVDPDKYSGFAFGVGLDRLAMLRYRIPDLRLLFENDLRFLQQF